MVQGNAFKKIKENILFVIVLLVSAILLFSGISDRALWKDETAVLEYYFATPSPVQFLAHYYVVPDNHPPLYYLLVILLQYIFPISVLSFRALSAISGILLVGFSMYLSWYLFKNKITALTTGIFMACSSYFILISQMARYHTLSALLALVALFFVFRIILESPKTRWIVLYSIFAFLTAYADVPHFIYLSVISGLLILFSVIKEKKWSLIKKWIIAQLILAVSLIPIAIMFYKRMVLQGDGDFNAKSILGNSWIDWILDVLMHPYAFFFGENMFPWDVIWFSLGIIGMACILYVLIKQVKSRSDKNLNLIIFCFAGFVLLNVVFMKIADPRYSFIVFPKYGFVAFPLFALLVGYGISNIKNVWLCSGSFVCILLMQCFGLYNFYNKTNYVNPSYFNSFSGFEFVEKNKKSGDLVYINGDLNRGVYELYKNSYFSEIRTVEERNVNQIPAGVRVWFFSTASDEGNVNVTTESKIPERFIVSDKLEVTPLTKKLKEIKEKVLHRTSYTYKNGIYLLIKK